MMVEKKTIFWFIISAPFDINRSQDKIVDMLHIIRIETFWVILWIEKAWFLRFEIFYKC